MDALDFAVYRPRSPQKKVAGLVFTGRVIDKLRAALPGGNPNGYLPFVGFSQVWQHYTGIDLRELFDVVRDAQDESEVESWIAQRTAALDKDKLNAKMERFETSRMPAEWRPTFESIYPADLRERHVRLFELLEADDARLYGNLSAMDVRLVTLPEDFRAFDAVAVEYELSLPEDLRHRDFERQRLDLESHYGPPNAAFVANVDGNAAGCVAVTQLNPTTGVIKKLYVKPEFRGHGVARALMKAVVETAGARGFDRLVLDTDRERLNDAYRLYRALGFEDCEAYGDVDYANPTYMELKLR